MPGNTNLISPKCKVLGLLMMISQSCSVMDIRVIFFKNEISRNVEVYIKICFNMHLGPICLILSIKNFKISS